MKAYLKKVVFFIAPILILTYPLDRFMSYNFKQSNEYYGELEVWEDIYNRKLDIDLAIYGSSRAWVDINPEILEDSLKLKAYNFGMDGHNFWLQHLRHLEYLKYNTKPKHIILAVDFGSLQKRADLYQYEQFLPYMLWNKDMMQYTKSYEGFNYYDYYVPLLRYAGKPSVIKKSFHLFSSNIEPSEYRHKGFKAVDKQWTDEFERARVELKNYSISMDEASIDLLNSFIEKCKKDNIEVTLVYTPEYIDVGKIVTNRKSIINSYITLAKKHQIHFLDYSYNDICYDQDNFYNATHLNKKGSLAFSRLLAADLKNMVLQK